MKERISEVKRKTDETDVSLTLNLDGSGIYSISSGVRFLDHMLELFAKHGSFDLTLRCIGDVDVDCHHSVEDIGICLGKAFEAALGDKRGICRYGDIILPMDETLILCAADISGRSFLNFGVTFPDEYKVGDMDTEAIEEFFRAFVSNAGIALHVKKLEGSNVHHIIEGIFKAFARAMRRAVAYDFKNSDALPSTKGTL